MKTIQTLRDLYAFPGFRARAMLKSHPEYPNGYIIILERRQKKQFVPVVAPCPPVSVIGQHIGFVTWMPVMPTSTLNLNIAGLPAGNATP